MMIGDPLYIYEYKQQIFIFNEAKMQMQILLNRWSSASAKVEIVFRVDDAVAADDADAGDVNDDDRRHLQ